MTNLVALQKPYLDELVSTRSNVAVRLRQLMVTSAIDTNAVVALCRHNGESTDPTGQRQPLWSE